MEGVSAADGRFAVLVADQGLGAIVVIADAMRSLGYRPALITGPASDDQLAAWRKHHDVIEVVDDPYSEETLQVAARRIPGPLAGLFSCFDGCVLPAALAASALGLPHCDAAALRRARNKYEARVRLREIGVDRVAAALVGIDGDLAAVEQAVGPYPLIVKPVNGIASHLVVKCDSRRELQAALHRLHDSVSNDLAGMYSHPIGLGEGGHTDPSSEFLVEPFLAGPEYSAELVVSPHGVSRIVLLEKLMVDDASFFETGYLSVEDPAVSEPIWEFIEAAVTGIGLDSAVCHVEVIDTAEGVSLVEINAGRPGGGLITTLARGAVGRDEMIETVRAALYCWSPEHVRPEYPLPAGMVISYPPGPGVIERVEGVEECRHIPGVVSVSSLLHPGDVVNTMDRESFGVVAVTAGVGSDGVREIHRQMLERIEYVLGTR
ncbi:MAG TPA: ATP-grasp domain-containing protein [Jatrophihabitans sp.]|nr:ATP-grasp domain-containing protein [Jatrophihabitans sp.]